MERKGETLACLRVVLVVLTVQRLKTSRMIYIYVFISYVFTYSYAIRKYKHADQCETNTRWCHLTNSIFFPSQVLIGAGTESPPSAAALWACSLMLLTSAAVRVSSLSSVQPAYEIIPLYVRRHIRSLDVDTAAYVLNGHYYCYISALNPSVTPRICVLMKPYTPSDPCFDFQQVRSPRSQSGPVANQSLAATAATAAAVSPETRAPALRQTFQSNSESSIFGGSKQ